MSQQSSYFIYENIIYNSKKEILPFFEYSLEEIHKILEFSIENIEDIENFISKIKLIFSSKKDIEMYNIEEDNSITEKIQAYSMISQQHLRGNKKEQYQHIQAISSLIETLFTHYKNLAQIPQIKDFNTQLKTINTLYVKEIKLIAKELKNSIKELDENVEKNLELSEEKNQSKRKYNQYKSNFSKHSKLYQKYYNKTQKLTKKIDILKLKEKLLHQKEKELQISLQQLELKQEKSGLYIPFSHLLFSLGLLYYSKLNTYEKQHQLLHQKIFKKKLNIEKNTTKLIEFKEKIEIFTKEYKHHEELSDISIQKHLKDNILAKNEEIEEIKEKISQLKENIKKLEKEEIVYKKYSKEVILEEIDMILKPINDTISKIHQLYARLDRKQELEFENGYYFYKE